MKRFSKAPQGRRLRKSKFHPEERKYSVLPILMKEKHMRLIIIRHGDPDYSVDSLTEKGWREAELLAERIAKLDVKAFYVSPLGRAKDTASLLHI